MLTVALGPPSLATYIGLSQISSNGQPKKWYGLLALGRDTTIFRLHATATAKQLTNEIRIINNAACFIPWVQKH